jgi:antitoxin Phd
MAHMAISQVREQFPSVIDLAQTEAVIVERHGTPQAVIISHARYEQLMSALEDAEDISALAEVKDDITRHGTIPWEEVRQDLGL